MEWRFPFPKGNCYYNLISTMLPKKKNVLKPWESWDLGKGINRNLSDPTLPRYNSEFSKRNELLRIDEQNESRVFGKGKRNW